MTGTDLLIGVADMFREGEPKAIIVVWTDENAKVCMKTNCTNTQAIGLAEYAKQNLLRGMFD